MIWDHRTYTLKPGGVEQYFAMYRAEGYAIQTQVLGRKPVGYFYTEIGPLNQVVHIWAYQDLVERQTLRDALFADSRWKAYVAKVTPLIVTMENKILRAAPLES